jgi:hypothetical protein
MSGQNKVILPGGSGKFSINVSSMTKESKLHLILRQGVKIGGIVSPLFGFPAISIPAAQVFTAIYSLLEERASFIMSSPLIDAAATQQAIGAPGFPPSFVALKSGTYVVVPQSHTDKLTAKLQQLKMTQGYIVDPSVPGNRPVQQIANESVPDVTYVSFNVGVKAITLPSSQTSNGANSGGSGPAAAARNPAAAKKAAKKP